MSEYTEKLKLPEWQKKRLEVLERAGWQCQLCGCSTEQLHVHHPSYEDGKEPWEYENLISLCHICHERVHGGVFSKPRFETSKAGWLCAETIRSKYNLPYVDPLPIILILDAMVGRSDAQTILDSGVAK